MKERWCLSVPDTSIYVLLLYLKLYCFSGANLTKTLFGLDSSFRIFSRSRLVAVLFLS